MRWLLLKDLQILRRSPLLVLLLVAYAAIVAVILGLALSSKPAKPKVAIFNEVPAGQGKVDVGGQSLDIAAYSRQLTRSIDPIRVQSASEATDLVSSGEALAAIIIPGDIVDQFQSLLKEGIGKPTIQLVLNSSDPLQREFVDQAIKARLQDLQANLSGRVLQVATQDLGRVLNGGSIDILGQNVDLLGLKNSRAILERARDKLPRSSPQRAQVDGVVRFADLAIEGLGFAAPVLGSIGTPLTVDRTELAGKTTPADAYSAAIAVAVSLMFIALLLSAGMLALEREEHAWGRLVRGLVSRTTVLAEKTLLAGALAALTGVVISALVGLFVTLEWGRFPLWLVALALSGLAFSALGVAVGALTREVRAASLLAFLLALPIAFLALVPANAVSGTLHDVLSVVSGAFPFKPALQAISAALTGATDPGLGLPLVHLVVLGLVYGGLARVAVRRF